MNHNCLLCDRVVSFFLVIHGFVVGGVERILDLFQVLLGLELFVVEIPGRFLSCNHFVLLFCIFVPLDVLQKTVELLFWRQFIRLNFALST